MVLFWEPRWAPAGFGSWLLSRLLRSRIHPQHERVVRVQASVQIGRPIEEVFRAWSNLEQLPSLLRMLERVHVRGNRSHWVVRVDGRRFEWDAELTQRLENQALAWKSLSGPKHTGRITFSPLGHDAQMHVVINYSPPLGALVRSVTEETGVLEAKIEQALRDFKAALEGKRQEKTEADESLPAGACPAAYWPTSRTGPRGPPGRPAHPCIPRYHASAATPTRRSSTARQTRRASGREPQITQQQGPLLGGETQRNPGLPTAAAAALHR